MTKALGLQDTTELHQKFNDARDWVQLEGSDNWLIGGVFGGISDALNAVVLFFQELIAIPAFPRPVPEIGWLGVIAFAVWFTYAVAGLRSTDPGHRSRSCSSVSSTCGRTAWTR